MGEFLSIKKFIILQLGIMLMIFFGYALILPQIKSDCSKIDLCTGTISCDCENELCLCKYYDEDGNIKDVECPNNYLD
ncbi:MAG: hypothetical protein PHG03_03985 [Bacilli bacterium]|nr:hypothetical protein [Bacilli bacterium]MDD4795701.1 hypothetical protein [Bacilli bacterium]